jgi:hypothetical protein
MGLKQLKTRKQELCLLNPIVNSALHIQNILLREEINLIAEWKMGLNTGF